MSHGKFPLISDALVKTGGVPKDKASAIRQVGELLLRSGYVDTPYLASMSEREKAADTFLGAGVAIPHGKVEDKGYVLHDGIAVLQVPGGVEWNPGQIARLVVGIAAKSDGHLAILKRLTRLIQDEEKIAYLSSTDDVSAIVSALLEESVPEISKPSEAEDLEVSSEWVIDYPSGLHARPASLWVNAAKALEGPLRLRRGSDIADPRNLLSLLRLGIKSGETIVISASGDKAEESVRRLKDVMAGISAQEKEDFERAARMKARIDEAKAAGDTLGGVFEIVVRGLPVGLGSHTQWDARLDGKLAGALMSIQAIKGVEIGAGFACAHLPGSEIHDELYMGTDGRPYRRTNRAGGLEGGMTNGETLIVRAAMKPIPTLMAPLKTVDIATGREVSASKERSDACAVPAASVVGEAMVSYVLADAICTQFHADSMTDLKSSLAAYRARLERVWELA